MVPENKLAACKRNGKWSQKYIQETLLMILEEGISFAEASRKSGISSKTLLTHHTRLKKRSKYALSTMHMYHLPSFAVDWI